MYWKPITSTAKSCENFSCTMFCFNNARCHEPRAFIFLFIIPRTCAGHCNASINNNNNSIHLLYTLPPVTWVRSPCNMSLYLPSFFLISPSLALVSSMIRYHTTQPLFMHRECTDTLHHSLQLVPLTCMWSSCAFSVAILAWLSRLDRWLWRWGRHVCMHCTHTCTHARTHTHTHTKCTWQYTSQTFSAAFQSASLYVQNMT